MPTSWKLIRVPAELAIRIEALSAAMLDDHITGRASLPNQYCEWPPAHHVIDRAVTDFEDHRRRSRQPRRRAAKL